MNMLKTTTAHFVLSEDGAITVDWVVLTAALVGLGLAVMAVVSGGVENLSGDIDTQLVSQDVVTSFPEDEPQIIRISARVGRTR